jgi:hypothetical protein
MSIGKVNKNIKCEEFRPINMYIEEKIIEHHVKDLLAFVDENNILCAEQSDFWPHIQVSQR